MHDIWIPGHEHGDLVLLRVPEKICPGDHADYSAVLDDRNARDMPLVQNLQHLIPGAGQAHISDIPDHCISDQDIQGSALLSLAGHC